MALFFLKNKVAYGVKHNSCGARHIESAFYFFKYNFHFIVFPGDSISLVFKDLAPCMGFGGGRGAAPAGLSRGGGVRGFGASGERFLAALL